MINWDLLIAALGLLIGLSASVATIWQSILTRRHNKLSVKPFLKTEGNYIPAQPMSIKLINAGFGPAKIKSVHFLVDGEIFISQNKDYYKELLIHIGLKDIDMKYYSIHPNDIFSQGESHYLLETIEPINNYQLIQKIKLSFSRLTIKIKYTSFYDEEFDLIDTHNVSP